MKRYLVISVYSFLILSTLLVFRQVRNFDFNNYDDNDYVFENLHVLNGLTQDGIIWAFTTGHAFNWHPITWLSLMLDCQLFGLNPGWMHLINLFLHLANTLLLFAVLKKMTGALWPSAFVAAVFALHPMHVESVAWIAERKDVLSTFFFLLTLAAYVSYVRGGGLFRYLLTVLLFVFGLLAKPMLVTLPFLLLLLDYWPLERFAAPQTVKTAAISERRRILYRIIIEKIPFFALAAVSSVITFIVQKGIGAGPNINTLSLQSRVANAFLSYAKYIGKMFWPQDLAVFYPFHIGGIPFWQTASCALLLLVITVLVICFGRKQRYLPAGWFWFVGTLVPVIGFVQVGRQAFADRYTYIPYIGLFIVIAWGLLELLSKWPYRWPRFRDVAAGKFALGIAAAMVLTAMGIGTYRQVGYWKNSSTLFTHALKVTQDNYIAHNNLGVVYVNLGRYQDAIETCRQAIKIKPDDAEAYYNLGNAYSKLGRWQDTIEACKQAIRIKPDLAGAYDILGVAYSKLGRWQDAIEACKQTIRIKPDYAEAYNNLGGAYSKLDRYKDAAEAYQQAIKIKPDWAEAHYILGAAYGMLGRYQDAIETYQQAIKIKPDYAEAHCNLGVAYDNLSRHQDAIEAYQQAIKIKPDYAEAHYNLGVAYDNLGRYHDAIEAYQQAIKIKPDYAKAHYNLGNAYAKLGRHQDAVETYKQAIRIKPDFAEAYCNLGITYLMTGDKGSALEEYKILKTLDAELANKLFNLIYK